MSNERHKTVADNVSANHKFREVAKMISHEEVTVAEMQQFLQPVTDCHGLGNAAATRNALESVRNWCINKLVNAAHQLTVEGLFSFVNSALAAQPRNCDVGTPEEQSARFDAHCRKHMGCLTCSLREKDGGVPKHCELAWAQMPYEEGGTE